ncbi:hypothetical protein K438DRAFT_1983394 [Mycena galopus ATCC 62051]|nr:hypothetical protein K438DRAFT_1983394 [Mycena galopus ATCC 62051]
MSQKPEIIHSASYWKDYHRQRAKWCTQQEQRAARAMAPGDTLQVSSAVPSQPPIITFMPNRPAPVYSLLQNDGTLAMSYDSTCIHSSPPPSNLDMKRLGVPAKCVPLPYPSSLAESRRHAAAKAQKSGPSEDDKLLARLTGRMEPPGRPKGGRAEESVCKFPSKKRQRLNEIAAPENLPVPALVHRVSDDGRRVYTEELQVEPPLPVKHMHLEGPQPPKSFGVPLKNLEAFNFNSFGMNSERYELGLELDDAGPAPSVGAKDKGSKVKPSDPSLSQWRAKRDTYLSVLLRRDGTGEGGRSEPVLCPACRTRVAEFRCRDCFGDVMYCNGCIVSAHLENPLHQIEKWHHSYFVRTSLAQLGLRVQLGHRPHQRCSAPEPAHISFITLHTNGIHEVRVDFCGCERAEEAGGPEIQLLRAGWFPATHERPQTCATITVLEKFHQDTLQSKVTMYDFYGVLEKLTDNTGIKPPDRYHKWIRMCCEFRHLMLLKRGRCATAYTGSGVEGTQQGELAIECPACPCPDVNLPAGWENAWPGERFLYTLFLALDACFRLKRRLVSKTGPYRDYLRGVKKQSEMNTCSGLAALDYANTKFSRGYSTTGVGMAVCTRHEFVQLNGVGDLQKGEQFSNMDYIFACVMRRKHPKLLKLVTYDIMCIWKKFLASRLKNLPANVWLVLIFAILRFGIPKMHIHSHTLICQLLYSLNLILGSAQCDAEGIERVWAWIGAVAASTRDMGPGSCHDVLDCQWGYWNWQKLVGIVDLLKNRLDRAEPELKEQTEAFKEFSSQHADRVPVWRQQVLDYEAEVEAQAKKDNVEGGNKETLKAKNPYEIKIEGLSEAQVRLQFTKEEAADAARGMPSMHDVSASSFIAAALDLEEEQRRLRLQAELKKAGTTGMEIDLTSMRTKLNHGIACFCKIQGAYMPPAIQALGELALPAMTLAEDVPLLLPSSLTEAQRARCAEGLEHIEALMRDAQCRTSLSRLRCQLHVKSGLFVYKKNCKIRLHSEKYQVMWDALQRLNGDDEELIGWKVVRREDIRCVEDEEDLRKKEKDQVAREAQRRKNLELRAHGLLPAEEDESMEVNDKPGIRGPENQRQLSWIWVVAGTDGTDTGLENALHVKWSKAFARVGCWDEEARLLREEFRRVCFSFEHEERQWRARAATVPVGVLPLPDAEVAVAYALQHTDMYVDLRERGIKRWSEQKLARGKKRAPHVPGVVGAMEAEARAEEAEMAGSALGSLRDWGEADNEDEEDRGACGDVESDKEFILGGEGFDD